jgi:hypothetical protein
MDDVSHGASSVGRPVPFAQILMGVALGSAPMRMVSEIG